MKRIFSLLYLTVLVQTALAQNNLQLLGAGYGLPGLVVAPGQVITLFLTGAKTIFPEQPPIRRAATTPLPTSLAGFSVLITQGSTHPSQQLLPIFSVQQTNVCADLTAQPSCLITAITVQIPMDLFGILPNRGGLGDSHTISITENGNTSASFGISLLADSVHIMTTCDSVVLNQGSGPCSATITHADGTTVSLSAPATAGETLSMYAVGLGITRPAVALGTMTPAPAPVTINEFMMQYSYAIDPAVSASSSISPFVPAAITFIGLNTWADRSISSELYSSGPAGECG